MKGVYSPFKHEEARLLNCSDCELESNSGPEVSVVIPHYSDLRNLDLCLGTLQSQTFPLDRFEVVVADNASPEGEKEIARIINGRASLVIVKERGAGPARNGGVSRANGRILAFIDSDCRAEPSWLERGVAALSDYDFVGGKVRVLVENPAQMTAVEAFERVFAFDFESYINKKGFTGSGNLFCPREMFLKVGGFSVGVSEDVEWSHRATAAGFRLGYAPNAVVGHPGRRTWGSLRDKWVRVNRETFGLYRRRPAGRLIWLLRNLALPLSAVVHTPKVLFSGELNLTSQRLNAIAVLYRIRLWRLVDAVSLVFGAS